MPYIPESMRVWLCPESDRLAGTSGELNYQVTEMCLRFVATRGESYETLNAIIGVLESAKLEFYRRKVALYEDNKILENGDVY